MEDEFPYAVRWPQKSSKQPWADDGAVWTKWHWVEEGMITVCGWPIVLFADDNVPHPQVSDAEQVNCKHCRRKMAFRKDTQSSVHELSASSA